jgi:uroporphyrin-III C-methyltransferase/precorrin-2 dehydrogenase/sirohydrochlorin ferrochelatase
MELLPIFLDVRDRPCLVVGGGEVAARKVALLREAGARVRVVAPSLAADLAQLGAAGGVEVHPRRFEEADLEGAHLAIAATDDPEVNARVSRLASARRIPVNVVDQPELCTFVVPSIIDRSPVVAAVSTGGAAPVLARLIRARLETLIPASYGRLAALAAAFRGRVKRHFPHPPDRRKFWERALQGPVAELVFSGREQAAEAALAALLEATPGQGSRMGEVYLVGGGPGDPDLLTFRALRLMQQADVVVHDRLVAKEVLELCRRDAERIYVGKERDNHAMPQEEINHLLARLAKAGKRVLRLKGGDPFIFGRGGEEIETLAAEGVPFQVVPGITAASGVASYAGIPLTHRDYAQACVFVTGHLKDGSVDLNWPALAQPQQTVVFYMGLKGLDAICRELQRHGLPASTPAALVQQGTTQRQRVYVGSLASLPDLVHEAAPRPPTLIIVGEVVRLHEKLAWFEPAAQPEAGHSPRPER